MKKYRYVSEFRDRHGVIRHRFRRGAFSAYKRFGSLTTNCPDRLRLLALVPGQRADEQRAHAALAHLRTVGEWYRATPDLRSFIRRIKSGTLATL